QIMKKMDICAYFCHHGSDITKQFQNKITGYMETPWSGCGRHPESGAANPRGLEEYSVCLCIIIHLQMI
ncbi:MAG TPA: hypothetical protein O0Y08_04720, partial [Methanocorpusculum sp.]|nr:hypothetical protein [Methanocorpusculum sp.]